MENYTDTKYYLVAGDLYIGKEGGGNRIHFTRYESEAKVYDGALFSIEDVLAERNKFRKNFGFPIEVKRVVKVVTFDVKIVY